MHNYATYYGNLLIPKFYIIFVPTKPALNFGLRLKDYTRMIFNDFIPVSPLVPSLDDVFTRLLRLSSTQTLSTNGPSDSYVLAS